MNVGYGLVSSVQGLAFERVASPSNLLWPRADRSVVREEIPTEDMQLKFAYPLA